MEVESSPTLEELANGNGAGSPGSGGGDNKSNGDAVDGATMMPSPAVPVVPGSVEDQRIKKKARRLIRTGSRDGHPHMAIPGQAAAFIAPHRR